MPIWCCLFRYILKMRFGPFVMFRTYFNCHTSCHFLFLYTQAFKGLFPSLPSYPKDQGAREIALIRAPGVKMPRNLLSSISTLCQSIINFNSLTHLQSVKIKMAWMEFCITCLLHLSIHVIAKLREMVPQRVKPVRCMMISQQFKKQCISYTSTSYHLRVSGI